MKNDGFKVKVRLAKQKDVNNIYKIGTSHSDFAVSKRIRFYERNEIKEWIRNKSHIFLVAEKGNKIIGFLCCIIISRHWAMIDNLFILPEYRHTGNGKKLLETCIKKLKERKIDYATRLIKLKKFSKKYPLMGFKPESKYIWVDEFIS